MQNSQYITDPRWWSTPFGFDPKLFRVGGGMFPRPEQNALLLITHPGGARSFDYEDRWDAEALIYTGHGQTGTSALRDRRPALLESAGVAVVLVAQSGELRPIGQLARELLTGCGEPAGV